MPRRATPPSVWIRPLAAAAIVATLLVFALPAADAQSAHPKPEAGKPATPASSDRAAAQNDADALMQLLQQAPSAALAPAPAGPQDNAQGSRSLLNAAKDRAGDVLVDALSYIGIRYKYGGNTPERGFDCSGLVRWVYSRTWGLMLPRRADQIAQVGVEVPREQLQPGDLVFFNTLRRTFSHVGIYLGDGQFLHAPSSGGKVRIENLDQAYWQKRWNGGRRLGEQTEMPSVVEQAVSIGAPAATAAPTR